MTGGSLSVAGCTDVRLEAVGGATVVAKECTFAKQTDEDEAAVFAVDEGTTVSLIDCKVVDNAGDGVRVTNGAEVRVAAPVAAPVAAAAARADVSPAGAAAGHGGRAQRVA